MHFDNEEERRRPTLTKEDVTEIVKQAFEFHERGDHHQFVSAMVMRERQKQELREKIKAHVGGWAFVSIILYFITMSGRDFKATLSAFFNTFR